MLPTSIHTMKNPFVATLFLALLPGALLAQNGNYTPYLVPPGYGSTAEDLPETTSLATKLADDSYVVYRGSQLLRIVGTREHVLLTLDTTSGPVFPSFIVQAGPSAVVFGENSNGNVWWVPTRGRSQPYVLANIVFNFDAILWDNVTLIVSAKTGGFATPDNEIVALNLATGATRVIGQVPGASGPLTRDSAGGLVYATAPLTFPPPPGAVQVLRWFESQVLAALNAGPEGGILGASNGQPLVLGLDSAGDIAMDTDGDFYFVDYGMNEVRVIAEIGNRGAAPQTFVSLAPSGPEGITFFTGLQFEGGDSQTNGPAFDPFAPRSGGKLLVFASDFVAASVLAEVVPLRARANATRTGNQLRIAVDGGPADGLGFVGLAFGTPCATELAVRTPFSNSVLMLNPAVAQGAAWHLTALSAQGTGSVQVGLPAGLQLPDCISQTVVVRTADAAMGTTQAVPVPLAR